MFRIVPYIAALLLALWLPVTQHCGLEEAGLIPQELPHEASAHCCDERGPCTHDACNIIESGLVKFKGDSLKVLAPDLVNCACLLCLQFTLPEPREEPVLAAVSPERPPSWVTTWQFVRRAAPLSRAPSLLG